MTTEQEIKNYLSNQILDIRKTRNARQFDQKGKTDAVSFIAECVVEYIKNNHNKKFGNNDIWKMAYFEKNVQEFFNKPSPSDPDAANEYDKFVSQPLLVLLYSGILKGKKNGKWKYRCNDHELLEYVSQNARTAHRFLAVYYEKIFNDSGLKKSLQEFITKQNRDALCTLRREFYKLMYNYTPIGSRTKKKKDPGLTECIRILNPALNVICAKYGVKGTQSGSPTRYRVSFTDLMYNRINFRDKDKGKSVTRKKALQLKPEEKSAEKLYAHYELKSRQIIKDLYGVKAQFKDKFSQCVAAQVHHILPKNEYLQFGGYIENMINLSPTQHLNIAHQHSGRIGTKRIEPVYQRKLLISNTFYAEKYISKGKSYYEIDNFIEMMSEAFGMQLSSGINFDQLRSVISAGFFNNKELSEIKRISKI